MIVRIVLTETEKETLKAFERVTGDDGHNLTSNLLKVFLRRYQKTQRSIKEDTEIYTKENE